MLENNGFNMMQFDIQNLHEKISALERNIKSKQGQIKALVAQPKHSGDIATFAKFPFHQRQNTTQGSILKKLQETEASSLISENLDQFMRKHSKEGNTTVAF